MEKEHLEALKNILGRFSEDPVDAFVAWAMTDPDSLKNLVDAIHSYSESKYALEKELEIW